MITPTPQLDCFDLDSDASLTMLRWAEAASFDPYPSDSELERFLGVSAQLLHVLPPGLIQMLSRLRSVGTTSGALLIRGLDIDEDSLGPTPRHWSLTAQEKRSFVTEMLLIGITSMLGEPYSFSSQHDGNLIQNIIPLKRDQSSQTGMGSKVFLEWHVEDAFTDFRADFVGLLCLRSDPRAVTTLSCVRDLRLPEHEKRLLFEERYLVEMDGAHERIPGFVPPKVAILSGSWADPFIRFDPLYMTPLPGDVAASAAFAHLSDEVPVHSRAYSLEVGDLLIFDNRRVVHGRTAYEPKFDGTDRWLQRVAVTADLRKSAQFRNKKFRVIDVTELGMADRAEPG